MKQKPFQRAGTDWLRHHPRALLADEPGLGKTNQALLAAEGRTLIVAPARLSGVWEDEIAKWNPDIDPVWVSYSSLCEKRRTNDGRLRTLSIPRPAYKEKWDTVILDEAHNVKNRKAFWTIAIEKVTLQSDRMVMLTGTPIPNWSYELFIPLKLMHPGDRRFTSYWRWVETWFVSWEPMWGGRMIRGLKKGITWDQFHAGNDLDKMMLRRLRDDVLADLPPLTEQTIEVGMVPAQRRAYEQLKKEYHAWVEEAQTEISVWNDGGRAVKLAKLTTGLDAELPGMRASGKLDAVDELLEEREGSPVVLFCYYRNTATALAARARKQGRKVAVIMGGVPQAERNEIARKFQRGGIDVLVGTLDTISEGITLTRSATCILVEHSWRPSTNEQAMYRLLRIGQTLPVTVIHLITKNSLDQRMMRELNKKTDHQVRALDIRTLSSML